MQKITKKVKHFYAMTIIQPFAHVYYLFLLNTAFVDTGLIRRGTGLVKG